MFQGNGVLNGPGKLAVTKNGGPAEEFTADKTIIGVGSVPSRIPGWPSDPNRVATSDEALHWSELPKSLLIVGGVVIGCEFGCMLRPFGVEVTIVEMLPQLLPMIDTQIGNAMEKTFTKRGIKCFTSTRIENLTADDNGIQAVLSNGQTVQAEKALVATGRRPNTANVGLESIGLSLDRGFVRVNDEMESAIKGTYCIGDANGRCLLAHAASAQAVVAVESALGKHHSFEAPVPNCVYTFPEIGAVGMTEQEAREQNLPISIGNFALSHLGRALAANDTEGFVKTIRHRETNQLLGVHMIGHNATECIAAAGALLHQKATVQEVAETVFAHPTMSEAIRESAEDALSMGLHAPPRKVLRVAV
jgi:dihydrolipoamide dehydrogenase